MNSMAKNGGTSGGSPASSARTVGTGNPVGASALWTRAWRSMSRLRTGSSPGGHTLIATFWLPSTTVQNARLDAPPVSGVTGATSRPPNAARSRARNSSSSSGLAGTSAPHAREPTVHRVDRRLDLGVGVDEPLHLLARRRALRRDVLAREQALVRCVLLHQLVRQHVEVDLVGTVHHRHRRCTGPHALQRQ